MSDFLQGATMLAAFAIAVFFLRYWRDTADRLFGVFAAAFALFGVSRAALHVLDADSETRVWVYALRAAAFLAIIVAIVDKNVRTDGRHDERAEDADSGHD
jgi:O-antigen/teichoic acid export membrane protein